MKLEYRTKKYWYNLIITPIFLILLAYIYSKKLIFDLTDVTSMFWFFILGFSGIVMIKDFFHMAFGCLKIEIKNQALITEYHNGFYIKKQDFEL